MADNQLKAQTKSGDNIVTEADSSNKAGSVFVVAPIQAAQQKLTGKQQPNNLRANNLEKVRRGLSNFVNHFNPAPFFIPPTSSAPPLHSAASKSVSTNSAANGNKNANATGMQAEPATIVNDAPNAEVLIKGPNRLVQARRGPFRWGR